MTKHSNHWKMLLACGVPLLIIILLPLFGITGNWIWFIALFGMLGAHLFMGRHGSHSDNEHKNETKSTNKLQNIKLTTERRKI